MALNTIRTSCVGFSVVFVAAVDLVLAQPGPKNTGATFSIGWPAHLGPQVRATPFAALQTMGSVAGGRLHFARQRNSHRRLWRRTLPHRLGIPSNFAYAGEFACRRGSHQRRLYPTAEVSRGPIGLTGAMAQMMAAVDLSVGACALTALKPAWITSRRAGAAGISATVADNQSTLVLDRNAVFANLVRALRRSCRNFKQSSAQPRSGLLAQIKLLSIIAEVPGRVERNSSPSV